jgi:DNA-directed RNA polymerase subunit RPC12/RpoP
MATATYFVQQCPTCGRKLQVRLEYLGRRVVCQHCSAELVARDPASAPSCDVLESPLLARADELLAAAERSGILQRGLQGPTVCP